MNNTTPPNSNDNAIGAALASMLSHVLVKKDSVHLHFKGWSNIFTEAVLTDLHLLEVRTVQSHVELHFVYVTGDVEVLNLDYHQFTGETLHDPEVQIAQAYFWEDSTEDAPAMLCWQPATLDRKFTLEVLHSATVTGDNLTADLSITSNGPSIVATNYWTSELARCGAPAVSMLEGHIRLLLPDALRKWALGVSPSAQWFVVVTPAGKWRIGTPCVSFVFADGDRVQGLNVDPEMFVGPMTAGVDGTKVPVSLWASQDGRPHCAALRFAVWTTISRIGMERS